MWLIHSLYMLGIWSFLVFSLTILFEMCQIESQVRLSQFSLSHRSFLHKDHFQENILIIFSLSFSLLHLFISRLLFSFSRIIGNQIVWQKVPSPTSMSILGEVSFSLCLFLVCFEKRSMKLSPLEKSSDQSSSSSNILI